MNKKIIISLTTYPKRMKTIHLVLDSLFEQTIMPDKVVLYLSEEQFEDRKIFVDFSCYFEKGLEIRWCKDDLKSHKKYFYVLQEFTNDIVITVDDDVSYSKYMVEELLKYHQIYPKAILARRGHLITAKSESAISDYENWWGECSNYIGIPRMDICATGIGGILYPPHVMPTETFNVENIKEHCFYADDIWLKIMQLINHVPTAVVQEYFYDTPIEEYVYDGLYDSHNHSGGNDRQFNNLIKIYGRDSIGEQKLIQRIFSDGKIFESEVEKEREKTGKQRFQNIIKTVENADKIVIYGAGKVAKRIYHILKAKHLHNKINCFAVEDITKNENSLFDIPVKFYKENISKDSIYIIGLANMKEQMKVSYKLKEQGVSEENILKINREVYKVIADYDY